MNLLFDFCKKYKIKRSFGHRTVCIKSSEVNGNGQNLYDENISIECPK